MSTSENEASNYAFGQFNCDHCYLPAKRFPFAECGHLQMQCSSCSILRCIVCQSSDSIKWLDPKLMDCPAPITYPPLKDTSRPITNFSQTREEPKVNMSEIDNKIKAIKTEIMKEMRTEVLKEMDRMKKNEEMNSSALSVLFKKEKERETQWAEREMKMDQTIDCLSLKLADLETRFNEKGPQQQEIAKDRMEEMENLKVENEKMSQENSVLKDVLKNFAEVQSKINQITEEALRQRDHYRNERQALVKVNETLITQLRGYENLKMGNEKMSRENSELKDELKRSKNDLEGALEALRWTSDQVTEMALRQDDHFRSQMQTLAELNETQNTHMRGHENLKKEIEKMSEENFELKKKLKKVEKDLRKCKYTDVKKSQSILLPAKEINSQGTSAATKKKSGKGVRSNNDFKNSSRERELVPKSGNSKH